MNIFSLIASDLPFFVLQVVLPETLRWTLFLAVIWVPIVIVEFAWEKWLTYVRTAWAVKIKKTLLEIKLPRETVKSPKAMELVLNTIHNTSDGGIKKMYWEGESRPEYSFELISEEGKIKFLIRTEDRRKKNLMAALYSQYPGIEIHEREDYADKVYFDAKTMKMWAVDLRLTKPDPYPIKTYIDYGLDKDPKEEYKIDPMVPGLEWMGSASKDQHIWIQMIVRAHKKDKKHHHLFAKEEDNWKAEAEKIISEEFLKRDSKTKIGETDEEGKPIKFILSKAEQEIAESIARSVSKPSFDVGIRVIYLATKPEAFDPTFGIGGVPAMFKHYSSEHLNGFAPNGNSWLAAKIKKDKDKERVAKDALQAYRRRGYFFAPYYSKPMVLNTEEFATIFHFPGSVAGTPTIDRIPSKRAEAPSNLPV